MNLNDSDRVVQFNESNYPTDTKVDRVQTGYHQPLQQKQVGFNESAYPTGTKIDRVQTGYEQPLPLSSDK